MASNLTRVSAFARERDLTEPQVRWWIFQARDNGLARAGAIVRIGRSVWIDTDRFSAWIEQHRCTDQQAAA